MKISFNRIKSLTITLLALVLTQLAWAGKGHSAPNEDTSFAVEYSYSCLGGGCHETDPQLVQEYSESFMTHAMVKCNACHGTHTAETLGLDKPNLTGYFPGIGPTGYTVGRDRCLACHNNQHPSGTKATRDCISCHTPHAFK